MHAQSMGYHTVYTDHSLFGLNDFPGINLNKLLKFTLTGVDYSICVSHTCRENLVLRASLDPKKVAAENKRLLQIIANNQYDPRSIYLFDNQRLWKYARSKNPAGEFRVFQGMGVFLPE